ncbi:MAG: glycine zipper 2TM domain-containing protein [Pseudomonadota bacterium]|nr:glycine zipper 2TM domain-containing protein [Pseudomonadota bacterium]
MNKSNHSTHWNRWIAAGAMAACAISLQACGDVVGAYSDEADQGASQVAAAEACNRCGTITAITPVKVDGEASGAGAVAGAIIGGVVGHQFGSGSGNDAATAAGAVGGAVAGNEVEKHRNSSTIYEVTIDLESGGSQTVNLASATGFSVGDEVRVSGDQLVHI